ncbi:hypothetical protein V7152_18990 [Neobacillus drentensis]
MKKNLEKLEEPEYYMEMEGYDTRLAVAKINDFIETLGDASLSITYANKDEHINASENELKIIRRIHSRHAIIDLNNSFDLLLQIPWFYCRIWQEFNLGGKLFGTDKKYKNNRTINRQSNCWVELAEKDCSYSKVIRYFENQNEKELLDFRKKLFDFNKKFVSNRSKKFTIRSIANQMKHNHSLKLEDFYSPNDFTIDIKNHEKHEKINLRKKQLGIDLKVDFYNLDQPDDTMGKIKVNYWDDLYIDIEYKSGEQFLAKDYMKENRRYSLDSIYKEMIEFGNGLIDLYENLLALIEPNISFNPMLPNKPIKKIRTVNLDKYFKS